MYVGRLSTKRVKNSLKLILYGNEYFYARIKMRPHSSTMTLTDKDKVELTRIQFYAPQMHAVDSFV